MTSHGSNQLRRFRCLIRDGATLMTACAETGLSLIEGHLTVEADAANTPPPEAFLLLGATPEGECEMAKAAKPKDEEAEIVLKPDFERAIRILRSDVNPLTEESAKIRGDQSAAWKEIEKDCHCNKKAMKLVHSLMRMDPEVRDDFLRTQYGAMASAKIGISQDLVDQMTDGDAPAMPTVKRESAPLVTVN
ncbi:MAG TPA: hypothetical protein VF503_00115 [Sphingobium sp.]|uniref:hypothetical protein n=1 Tax=Sphingobium sp. TaxID=1912891 RepID=UPI002ED18605